MNLEEFASRTWSQHGEDGILLEILRRLPDTPRTYLEFGVEDGAECCTRILREQGWQGIWWDARHQNDQVCQEHVTAANVNDLCARYGVPHDLGVLSIDVDGQDYWIWQALRCRPAVVVIEYNPVLGPDALQVIPPDPDYCWDGSDWYGASFAALVQLGRGRGYRAVASCGATNLFFVRGGNDGWPLATWEERPPERRHEPDPERRPYLTLGGGTP